ncbi:Unknown protein sequence [Pseudomonas syringae pv. maculicola]|nr:Unknown protein sequence [Pseudomonas syringae pv. maculicola]
MLNCRPVLNDAARTATEQAQRSTPVQAWSSEGVDRDMVISVE